MSSHASLVEFSRYFLAFFFTAVALFYISRILFKHNKESHKVIHTGDALSPNWVNQMTFRLFRALIWFVCLLRAINPNIDGALGILPIMQHSLVIACGLGLLVAGFTLTVFAHYSMGKQWRSGIDAAAKTQLVTSGLFGFSRNPMYLGVMTAQLGFFLALPSIFTLLCLVVGVTFILRQTQIEESHLARLHADEYQQYKLAVRKWF